MPAPQVSGNDRDATHLQSLQLSCRRRSHRGSPVIELAGELDLHTAPILRQALEKAISEQPPAIVVELRQLEYIDSTGIITLAEAQTSGKLIRLVGPTGTVFRVLELSNMAPTFPTYETVDEAVEATPTPQPD